MMKIVPTKVKYQSFRVMSGFFLVSLTGSLISLKYLRAPYVWIGGLWFLVIGYYSLTASHLRIRVVLVYLASMIFILTCYEAYLFWFDKQTHPPGLSRFTGTFPGNFFIANDPLLGYRLRQNTQASDIKYYQDTLVYQVTYTVNEQGLRRSSGNNSPEEPQGNILFFGDSFTFGIGVNDEDTLPYQVDRLSEGKYHIYNFGVSGYGPHQMLSALEHNIVSQIVNREKQSHIAIYQAILDHVQRSAGLAFWDAHGPRYKLDIGGKALFAGNFDDGKVPGCITNQLNKSLIYRKIFTDRTRTVNEDDLLLFLTIVDTSRNIFERQYPGGKFHVIFWDDVQNPFSENIINGLKKRNIRVHLISQILPEYPDNAALYKIQHDGHPNSLAHKTIAQYIAYNILKQ